MTMKKIMNGADAIVEDMLRGLEFANPAVCAFPEQRVIARRKKSDKVGLVSGGGVKMHQRLTKSEGKPAAGPEFSVPATG